MESDDDDSYRRREPLWVTPLYTKTPTTSNNNNTYYRELERIVTPTQTNYHRHHQNNEGEIETVLEAFYQGHELLWRRVVVKTTSTATTGSISSEPIVHASFMLPKQDTNDHQVDERFRTRLAWAAFPEHPHQKVLCVLATPTLLCIFNVNPSSSGSTTTPAASSNVTDDSDGHFIPLPFEAVSIHALPLGLLLQRRESPEDADQYQFLLHQQQQQDQESLLDEDGFFLKAPPKPIRLGGLDNDHHHHQQHPSSTTNASLNFHHQQQQQHNVSHAMLSSTGVPSLFSLEHPLEDVLPVIKTNSITSGNTTADNDINSNNYMVTDVFEKVLFCGTLEWVDLTDTTNTAANVLDRKVQSQPICVTYHKHRKRHAIWEITTAPPPPPQAPLWEVSRQWRSENGWNSHLGFLQQDLEDWELIGGGGGNVAAGASTEESDGFGGGLDHHHYPALSPYDRTTRQEALADALGVRKTPRNKPVEDMVSRSRNVTTRSSKRGNNTGSAHKQQANSSLLTPLSRPLDASHLPLNASLETAQTAPPLSMGPFSSLQPSIAMNCLYEESSSASSEEAENVFLASNLQGSGTLVVCLVSPANKSDNSSELKMVSFQRKNSQSKMYVDTSTTDRSAESIASIFEVQTLPSIPCISAVPVQSTPIPPCFRPHVRHCSSPPKLFNEDILLLLQDSSKGSILSLNRANVPITECALPLPGSRHGSFVSRLRNSVHDRLDFVCLDESQQEVHVRGSLSLVAHSSEICNRALEAIDAAMYQVGSEQTNQNALAFQIRADVFRLAQALSKTGPSAAALVEDPYLAALDTIMSLIFDLAMSGGSMPSTASNLEQPSVSAWEQLISSDFHRNYSLSNTNLLAKLPIPERKTDRSKSFGPDELTSTRRLFLEIVPIALQRSADPSTARELFNSLYALYEDSKLTCTARGEDQMRFVGSILARSCFRHIEYTGRHLKKNASISPYISQFRRDHGDTWSGQVEASAMSLNLPPAPSSDTPEGTLPTFSDPPCLLSWLDTIVSNGHSASPKEFFTRILNNSSCHRTRIIQRVFLALFENRDAISQHEESKRDRDVTAVNILIEEGFDDPTAIRDELPAGVALPLVDLLHRCRSDPETMKLLGKNPKVWTLVSREDLSKNICGGGGGCKLKSSSHLNRSFRSNVANEIVGPSRVFDDKDKDGIVPLEQSSSMLFPNDNRVKEVGRMLRSSRPVYLNVHRSVEVSDHDYERSKQERLLLLCRRVLALPVGRGMLTLGNLEPVPAEPLPVPEISLVGRVPPTNAFLALDISEAPNDLKVWPEFHNGVAAGLRLPIGENANDTVSKITRTWIVYNRPPENAENSSRRNADDPSRNQSHSHGGLLMALGLRGHLDSLEMTDVYDYLTKGNVTTTVGVLLGMAANKRGSCDVSVSKMLCLHIPSLIPQHFSSIDVASTVQAAAVVGAGLLYQGSSHRMMTEFLLNELGKRPSSDANVTDREAYTLSCGLALGMVNLSKGAKTNNDSGANAGLADLRIEERLFRYVLGGVDNNEMRRRKDEHDRFGIPLGAALNERCSCVVEGEAVNTDVTAPGATLALGLIYMKTGNQTIASAVSLPDTHFLLEYVRPDFLLLRVVARAMILWENVLPSSDWIESQLPTVVSQAFSQMKRTAMKNAGYIDGVDEGYVDVSQDYDRQAIRQIHCHIIAGACFALGLRYAGTGDREATEAISLKILELLDLRDAVDPVSKALRPTSSALELSLGCAATSLAMVQAGTGDLEVLRLLKVIRWRSDDEINYGLHMTYGSAIGLLFLGGGKCTLGRDPEDIAAMIAAFFPRYPSRTSDNQFHLQALRHMYALAVKHREFRAVDVDTGESVFVPFEVYFSDRTVAPLKLTAPCLLCNSDNDPAEIKINCERYYPLSFKLDKVASGRIFYVKKRSAHLTYGQDPNSQRSLLLQTGSYMGKDFLDLVGSFTEDAQILSFAKYFCSLDMIPSNKKSSGSDLFSLAAFSARILHQCMAHDSEEAIFLYLAIRSAINSVIENSDGSGRSVWDYRLIRTYFQRRPSIAVGSSSKLVNEELVVYLCDMFESNLSQDAHLSTYYALPLDQEGLTGSLAQGKAIDDMDTS